MRNPKDKADSKYNPDIGISKEDEERYQKLVSENDDLQKLIAQVSVAFLIPEILPRFLYHRCPRNLKKNCFIQTAVYYLLSVQFNLIHVFNQKFYRKKKKYVYYVNEL